MAYRGLGGAVRDRAEDGDWPLGGAAPSLIPGMPAVPRSPVPPVRTAPHKLPRFAEIDCVRHRLPPGVIALAEALSVEADVGADRVLIAAGFISEEAYVVALARYLNLPFEPLEHRPRGDCPLPDDRLLEAPTTGLLPLSLSRLGVDIVVVPRLVDSRRFVALAQSSAGLGWSFRLTTASRLQTYVVRHGAQELENRAVAELRDRRPEFSAADRAQRRTIWITATTIALAFAATPGAAVATVEIALAAVFLAWTGLRLLGLASERLLRRQPRSFTDDQLPTYSIVVALYREAAAVGGLIASLRALNYPPEKLDIKLVLEADDDETRNAIAQLQPGPPFEIIIAPKAPPRTKPKALNAALPFVRGPFVAVYDAEDRPEPDQLRLALEAFTAGDERLACVQARLTIDNTADSWLARLFTAEYAGLFDVFLPGLAAWRLPLPLGGSSNHFRTHVLREIGAWDPYNVTEDADLGMRLARFGYRSAVISSTTYEEAPAHFGPWLRQRTRWFKGWLQTWLVHMRAPCRLARDLGLAGFAVFQLLVGGSVLAALVHSLFAGILLWTLAMGALVDATNSPSTGLHAATLFTGYLISALLAAVGLARRGLLGYAWVLLLIPFYWLLLSLAAWRALFQLIGDPYRWEKTEHGLARTSRLAGSFAALTRINPSQR